MYTSHGVNLHMLHVPSNESSLPLSGSLESSEQSSMFKSGVPVIRYPLSVARQFSLARGAHLALPTRRCGGRERAGRGRNFGTCGELRAGAGVQ
jgi:hypothetical protein